MRTARLASEYLAKLGRTTTAEDARETLYIQAVILEKPDGDTDLSRHIFADHHLTEEQRQAMMRIYLSFRHENDDQAAEMEGLERAVLAGLGIPDPYLAGPT